MGASTPDSAQGHTGAPELVTAAEAEALLLYAPLDGGEAEWVARALASAPPSTDEQRRAMGQALGVRLKPR